MEDASRYAIRKPAEPLAVITPPRNISAWEQMPRQAHLLDYVIILRKHQWLILTFLLTVVTVVTIASLQNEARLSGGGARGSGSRIPERTPVPADQFVR